MNISKLIFLTLLLPASYANAEFVLQLPLGANETYSRQEPAMAPLVAIEPYASDGLKTAIAPDNIRRSVWSFGGEQTIAEVQRNILQQLEKSDYEILLFCQTAECGGFDFRFAIDVVPEPDMRVDLRDFRFISARQNVSAAPGYVTFFISRSPSSVYVQMTEYTPANAIRFETAAGGQSSLSATAANLELSFVLEGLEFDVGSANLGDDPLESVAKLAQKLKEDPSLQVLLVGHSDMSGSLNGNIVLSEKRAQTILQILVKDHGIDAARLSAHGVGFLAPRASNETKAGQEKNRRVEAVFKW